MTAICRMRSATRTVGSRTSRARDTWTSAPPGRWCSGWSSDGSRPRTRAENSRPITSTWPPVTGSEPTAPLQRLQVLHQVVLLGFAQIKLEEAVVVVHHIEQRREA